MKKVLSVLIVLAMVLAMVPVVSAESEGTILHSVTDVAVTPNEPYVYEGVAPGDGTVHVESSPSFGKPGSGFIVKTYSSSGALIHDTGSKQYIGDKWGKPTTDYTVSTGDKIVVTVYACNNYTNIEGQIGLTVTFYGDGSEPVQRTETAWSTYDESNPVDVGTHTVAMDPNSDYTLVYFEPSQIGVYTVSVSGDATVGWWGASSAYLSRPRNPSASLEREIKAVGNGAVFGISGTGEVTLTIEKTGESEGNQEKVYIEWPNQHTPDASLCFNGIGTAVDITQPHTAVLGEDGFYHLDAADGPVLFVDLTTQGFDLTAAFGAYGANSMKGNWDGTDYDFKSCMAKYNTALSGSSYVYPMTEDLYALINSYGVNQFWFEEGKSNFDKVNEGGFDETGVRFISCVYDPDITYWPEGEAPNPPVVDPEPPVVDPEPPVVEPDPPAGGDIEAPATKPDPNDEKWLLLNGTYTASMYGALRYTVTFTQDPDGSGLGTMKVLDNNGALIGEYVFAYENGKVTLPENTFQLSFSAGSLLIKGRITGVAYDSGWLTMVKVEEPDPEPDPDPEVPEVPGHTHVKESEACFYCQQNFANGDRIDTYHCVECGHDSGIVLETILRPYGCEENRMYLTDEDYSTSVVEFTASVAAGETLYLVSFHDSYTLTMPAAGCELIVDGKKITAQNGIYTAVISNGVGTNINITNTGSADAEFEMRLVAPKGTYENPVDLEIGTANSAVLALDNLGYYYVYNATCPGQLIISVSGDSWAWQVTKISDPDDFMKNYYGAEHYYYEKTQITSEVIDVLPGDMVLVKLMTAKADPESIQPNPAGTVTANATFKHSVDGLEKVPGKPADHVNNGSLEYYHCAGCNSNYNANGEILKNTIIPAEGHDAVYKPEVPATTLLEGMNEHWYCAECDLYFSDEACFNEVTRESLIIEKLPTKPPVLTDPMAYVLDGYYALQNGAGNVVGGIEFFPESEGAVNGVLELNSNNPFVDGEYTYAYADGQIVIGHPMITMDVSNPDAMTINVHPKLGLVYTLVKAEKPVEKEPEQLVVGENNVIVNVSGQYPETLEAEFTAPADGTYIITAGSNADLFGINNGASVELKAGEKLSFSVSTNDYMTNGDKTVVITIAEQSENPDPGEGENPNPGEGENPNPGEGENPNPGEGENPNPGEGENPNPGEGENPNPGEGENPNPGEGENPSNPGTGDSIVIFMMMGVIAMMAAAFLAVSRKRSR